MCKGQLLESREELKGVKEGFICCAGGSIDGELGVNLERVTTL